MSSTHSTKSEDFDKYEPREVAGIEPHETLDTIKEIPIELTRVVTKTQKFFESDAGDGTKREDHYMQGSKLYISFISVLFVTILVSIDMTITMSILTVLTDKFQSPEKVTWLLGAFGLGNGITLQVWSKISIITGRKYAMLAAIFIFEVGSLICALATSMNMLIAGRTIQGIGAGGSQGLVSVIITEIFPINKRSLAMSIYTALFGCMSIAGPFIGGALETVSWRWCFYLNLPIGGAAAIIFFFVYNPPRPTLPMLSKIKDLDAVGILLYFAGLSMFLVGLTIGGAEYPWKSAAVICCIVIGALCFLAFLYWNYKYSHSRIIPLDVLNNLQVQLAYFGFFFFVGTTFSIFQFLSLYFQEIRNKSPLATGVALLPVLITAIVVGVLLGVIIGKYRRLKPYNVLSLVFSAVGGGLISTFNEHSSIGKRVGYLIIFGIGFGLSVQPLFLITQIHAPKSEGGTILASTYAFSGRNIGIAFQSAISEIVYTTLIKNKLTSSSVIQESGYTANQILNTSPSLNNAAQAVLKDAYLIGIKGAFYYCTGCIAIYAIVLLSLTKDDVVPDKKHVNQSKKDREEDDNEKAVNEALAEKESLKEEV